jgi:hypothetical protein
VAPHIRSSAEQRYYVASQQSYWLLYVDLLFPWLQIHMLQFFGGMVQQWKITAWAKQYPIQESCNWCRICKFWQTLSPPMLPFQGPLALQKKSYFLSFLLTSLRPQIITFSVTAITAHRAKLQFKLPV